MITKFKIFENKNNDYKITLDKEEMLSDYIYTALWTEESVDDQSFDGYDIDDFTEEEKDLIRKDIEKFINLLEKKLETIGDKQIIKVINKLDPIDIGGDIWLTRNGHGSGFWDRDYCDIEFTPGNNPYGKAYKLCSIMTEVADEIGGVELIFEKPIKDYEIKRFKI